MDSKGPSRRELLLSCADLGLEDGMAARDFFRKSSDRVTNRKALQLCAQVMRTLNDVVGECGDDVLRDLLVQSVAPAPNSARLLVTVSQAASAAARAPRVVVERLEQASGLLRNQVAAAIHRRRVPELTFRLVQT